MREKLPSQRETVISLPKYAKHSHRLWDRLFFK